MEAENRLLEAEILALQKQKVLSLSPWGSRDLPGHLSRCDNSLLPPLVAPPIPQLTSSTKAQNFHGTSKTVRKTAFGVDGWLDMQFGDHGQIAVL